MVFIAKIQKIDRSLVSVFDIEDFSKGTPITQARLVSLFIENLNKRLDDLGDMRPDAFSTGDGAIVSVGRNCKIDEHNAKAFMDFVIDFTSDMLKKGLILRTAVNYSEDESALIIDTSKGIQGKYLQIGDAINVLSRIISFCEPREILIGESVHKLLRRIGLEKAYPFFKNDPVMTKHNEELKTFTYDPSQEQDYLYSPHCAEHRYKKFSYFPPISSSIIRYFKENGLDFELKNVVAAAFDSVRDLNETMRFISWHNVLDVLTQVRYDSNDSVYVLSRNDRTEGFWTQPRKKAYLDYLKNNANKYNGYINQTRIMVYPDSSVDKLMDVKDISNDLKKLHNTDTFFRFPSRCLLPYERLNELRFGFTLSTKHKYAIIPMPAPEAMDTQRPKLDDIGETLKLYEKYNAKDGPMRAIITADEKYVEELIDEFERLLKDPQTRKIK